MTMPLQVWVSEIDDRSDIHQLVRAHLPPRSPFDGIAAKIVDFWAWYGARDTLGKPSLSIRDLLAWCEFVSELAEAIGPLPAFLHGAFAVIIDGQGLGRGLNAADMKTVCTAYLLDTVPPELVPVMQLAACSAGTKLPPISVKPGAAEVPSKWGIEPFTVCTGSLFNSPDTAAAYHLAAPTTSRNCFRLLRAMQLPKPILLEGSPGVGKTSIITAVAAASGHELVRINLSDQTEILDLLGADLPSPDGTTGIFTWADGPLLRALRRGSWVLLDELNLASQAVLEGLNSVLDHRRSIFIPELGTTITAPTSFRVFAAQNPLQEGGGRKGLPRSFLNRFSRVSLDLLLPEDLVVIAATLYPQIPKGTLHCMVATASALHDAINTKRAFGHAGGPWEFNLRDLLRWCDLLKADDGSSEAVISERAAHYACMLFVHKLHTVADQSRATEVIRAAWQQHPHYADISATLHGVPRVSVTLTPHSLQIGACTLDRSGPGLACLPPISATAGPSTGHLVSGLRLAALSVPALEWTATACKMAWMTILVSHDVPRASELVRMLSHLCSQPLVEIPMTSMSDTSDLLGGFEQVDVGRLVKAAEVRLRHAAAVMYTDALCYVANMAPQEVVQQLLDIKNLDVSGDCEACAGSAPDIVKALQESVKRLHSTCASIEWSASVRDALSSLMPATAAAVSSAVAYLDGEGSNGTGGRFVWVDGLLLSAIEHGHWVQLKYANNCSSAVLDRLNSLLEPSGALIVNESGSTDSGPRVVKPHHNFRLFLVMDPSEGGLSRAMRNRGVEVFLDGNQFSQDAAYQVCAVRCFL